ncbi:MAG: EH signature domain-containing protein [Pleurocapsa sp.]
MILTLNHQDVEILQEDGSDPTEICIFDFGDWFVVEFFRGTGSETRIFKKDAKTEQQLFNSQLSIKKLRYLGLNNPIHDHVICWQYFCEQLLRQKNIFPNQGTENFKGVPDEYRKYNTTS